VHPYLCSNQWDTRIAAGLAVEAIATHVPEWQPQGSSSMGMFIAHCFFNFGSVLMHFAFYDVIDMVNDHGEEINHSLFDEFQFCILETGLVIATAILIVSNWCF